MTDVTKAADADTNTNALDLTPPELNPDRFLGAATKDGETITEPKPAAKDTNGKNAAKAPPKVDKGDNEDDGEKPSGDRPRRDPEKRIGQAVARQRAAERRADIAEATNSALERRLSALEAKGTGTGVDNTGKAAISGTGEPKPSDYEYGELDARFIKDTARYEARQEIASKNAESTSAAATADAQKAAKERATQVEDWVSKAPPELDDFDEVVWQGAKDGLWPLSQTIGDLLLDSDVGHQIAYALASDPKEATRVAKLSPGRQAAWFGKEEARLTADAESPSGTETDETATKPKVTQAPAPSSHRAKGSGSSTPVAADTNDFAAFERLAMKPN